MPRRTKIAGMGDFLAEDKYVEREMKKRLLLSPKTSFAVAWKYLTVACVALELGQFALAPALSGEFRKMPLDELLSSALSVPLDEPSAVPITC